MVLKSQIRADMKAFLAGLSPADRHARSLAACQQLAGTREFKNAQMIMIYLSMPTELETSTLAVRAWQEGKSVAVPRVDWNGLRMEPVEIRSLDVGMRTTGPGVPEPIEGTVVPLQMIDLIVAPGQAFDHQGRRVGRGRGFYDRFLAQKDIQAVRCGLCFHEQVLSIPIPSEPHDMLMNLVITDREVIHCGHEQKGFSGGNGLPAHPEHDGTTPRK
jgi:5-formyltetrahydrofolate cyclo-ligase